MAVCPRCGEENPDRFKLCGFCGASLAAPAPARRKLATVLFCDMTGSTAMGERLDAESVRELMFRYFRDMREAIERHGGTVEKFIGDAVMAVFGVPVTHEDDALRAVRAAAEMQERLVPLNEEFERRFGSPVALRIGVNTGEVVAGDPASAETIVTGDAVNVAARLEQAAPPGSVLLGEQTFRMTWGAVSVEAVEPLELKGKSERVPAYRLVRVSSEAAVPARRLGVGMVGRDRELEALREAAAAAAEGARCEVVTVLGDAGVGKSRLVAEFLASLDPGTRVLTGRCRSYGEGITYWPLAEALREAAGVGETDTAEETRGALAALLAGDPDAELVLELVSTAVGLGESGASAQQIAWATRRLLEALARSGPLVFVVDDLHWAEPLFFELLEAVATSSEGAPILLLCVARPELLERRPEWGAFREDAPLVRLEPLGPGEATELIEDLLGQEEVAEDVRARVIQSSEGNPLFLEELIGMLVDDGLIAQDGGRWVAAGDLSGISIPPTLDALLSSRLDRLAGAERETIERASVEGQTFHRGALQALSPAERAPGVESALRALTDKELIRQAQASMAEDHAFRFRHILIRDAAYRGLAKKARAELHEQFARWLELKAGARLGEYEEVIGLHYEQAHRYRAELGPVQEHAGLARLACDRLHSAGRRALLTRGDIPAALNLLERAAALVQPDDPTRFDLQIDLAFALMQSGERVPEAQVLLTKVAEEATAAGERGPALIASVELGLIGILTSHERRAEEVIDLARDAIPVLEEDGDDLALAKAWRLLGYTLALLRGQWSEAEAAMTTAHEHARLAGSRYVEGTVLNILGVAYVYGPTPVSEGIRRIQEMLAEAKGDPQIEAPMLVPLGRLRASLGEFDEARELIERGRRKHEESGNLLQSRAVIFQRADVDLIAGDFVAAEQVLRPAYELLINVGEKAWLALAAARLARALYALERYDEAHEVLQVCDEAAAEGQPWPRVVLPATRAKLHAQAGRGEEAVALARKAVTLSRDTDALELQADTLLDLAEVLRLAGHPRPEVAQALEDALGLYERKGNVPTAAVAREQLDEQRLRAG